MKVAVLGNGQLGQMLKQAGERIGIEVQLLDIDCATLPADLDDTVAITTEREHWPETPLTNYLQQHQRWHNGPALQHLSNRYRQKSLLDRLGIATAPWCAFTPDLTQEKLHEKLGPDVFLKRVSGGYDGRGQQRIQATSKALMPDWADAAIAEQSIRFDAEVSLIGARAADGSTVFYRLTENHHENGILIASLSRQGHFVTLQAKAQQMLQTVMDTLQYIGVMAMECFVVGDQLLVNEIAARVHNSGHWTQAGAAISQFELHLRALCALPMPQPVETGCSVMLNLVGEPFHPDWIKHGAAQLSWYGKQWRPDRKMGHVNFNHPDPTHIAVWMEELVLPATYQNAKQWLIPKLAPDPETR